MEAMELIELMSRGEDSRTQFKREPISTKSLAEEMVAFSNMRNPLIASFATKELPYRGIGTGILRALAAVPELELESNHDLNRFTARLPRPAE